MPRISLRRLSAFLCALFTVFSLGYYLGRRAQSGTYAIVTESGARGDGLPDAVYAPPDETPTEGHSASETPEGGPSPPSSVQSGDMRVNINTASEEELTDLPGVGPVLAGRIVDYRNAHGPYAAPEDLINVSGIGPSTLEKLLPYITTGG